MSSRKHILFLTDNVESEDSKKLYNVIRDNTNLTRTMDDREYQMGWSEHYYSDGRSYTFFREPEDWEYFGIENDEVGKFKDFKIIAKIDEQMDYDNPRRFEKETYNTFNFLSERMGDNNIYVVVFDDSSSGGLSHHKILNTWKGNFYDKKKNRDRKIKDLGI